MDKSDIENGRGINLADLLIDCQQPVRYLQSGQFSAELGWRHHLFTHQADTEVIIGLSGRIQLAIGSEQFKVEAGDVLTVFPFESIVGTLATVTPSQFIWVHFIQNGNYQIVASGNPGAQKSQTVGGQAANNQPTGPTPSELAATTLRIPRYFHLAQQEKVLIAAKQLLDVAHSPYFAKMAENYQATMLLIELANASWQERQGISSNQTSLNEIKEWIRVRMDQDLRVAAVAAHFGLNPDYLTRRFKQELGVSVKAYMNSVKLDWAKYLLLTTRLSVAEVSQQAYFQDAKYFMRFFKQQTRLTPSQYRHAYTHTFLNNQQVDPGVDISAALARQDLE